MSAKRTRARGKASDSAPKPRLLDYKQWGNLEVWFELLAWESQGERYIELTRGHVDKEGIRRRRMIRINKSELSDLVFALRSIASGRFDKTED